MDKWLKNKQKQKIFNKAKLELLKLQDAILKIELTTEDLSKSINDFAKMYSKK